MKRLRNVEEVDHEAIAFRAKHTPHLRTKPTVLNAFLVEDSADIRNTMVEAMQEMMPILFVGIATAENSATEWLADRHNRWDVAIVDLMLKEGTGFGVIEACRKREKHQKVVVLTSFMDEDLIQRCRELGADEVFDKTQDIQRLVNFCKVHAIYIEFMLSSGVIPLDQRPEKLTRRIKA